MGKFNNLEIEGDLNIASEKLEGFRKTTLPIFSAHFPSQTLTTTEKWSAPTPTMTVRYLDSEVYQFLSDNTVKILVPGYYRISSVLPYNASHTYLLGILFRVNGANLSCSFTGKGNKSFCHLSSEAYFQLVPGDVVGIAIYQDQPCSTVFQGGERSGSFIIERLGD